MRPTSGLLQKLGIHPVKRNGSLRDIIQKVLNEQMYRQHGQKRQKCTGEHHTEHIAEIGTGGHLYVFGDIAKGLTPFQDTLFEHTQIFVQKNDIGTLLRNVHGRIYGNTNVRLPQCSGIIHPVTQNPTVLPFC